MHLPLRRMLIPAFVAVLTAIILFRYPTSLSRWWTGKNVLNPNTKSRLGTQHKHLHSQVSQPWASVAQSPKMTKTPVYFLSHGGPNIMEDVNHPAHKKLQEIGREITEKVKPKAVVVFSAHWQAGPRTVQVNTAEMTELIYE